jgi:hypothetical protein
MRLDSVPGERWDMNGVKRLCFALAIRSKARTGCFSCIEIINSPYGLGDLVHVQPLLYVVQPVLCLKPARSFVLAPGCGHWCEHCHHLLRQNLCLITLQGAVGEMFIG